MGYIGVLYLIRSAFYVYLKTILIKCININNKCQVPDCAKVKAENKENPTQAFTEFRLPPAKKLHFSCPEVLKDEIWRWGWGRISAA